ncbi:hypothetical protein CCUS01_11449, partial [Colletotrichum cuscutae]
WRQIDLRRQITRLCRGHVLTILRKIGGTATTVASVYIAVTRDEHDNKIRCNSLWCLALAGGGLIFLVWRHMSRLPNVYTFLSIALSYATLSTLLKGPGLILDGFLPVLPLVVISGGFLASLFLSVWKSMASSQNQVVEPDDGSAWGAVASCLV